VTPGTRTPACIYSKADAEPGRSADDALTETSKEGGQLERRRHGSAGVRCMMRAGVDEAVAARTAGHHAEEAGAGANVQRGEARRARAAPERHRAPDRAVVRRVALARRTLISRRVRSGQPRPQHRGRRGRGPGAGRDPAAQATSGQAGCGASPQAASAGPARGPSAGRACSSRTMSKCQRGTNAWRARRAGGSAAKCSCPASQRTRTRTSSPCMQRSRAVQCRIICQTLP